MLDLLTALYPLLLMSQFQLLVVRNQLMLHLFEVSDWILMQLSHLALGS